MPIVVLVVIFIPFLFVCGVSMSRVYAGLISWPPICSPTPRSHTTGTFASRFTGRPSLPQLTNWLHDLSICCSSSRAG